MGVIQRSYNHIGNYYSFPLLLVSTTSSGPVPAAIFPLASFEFESCSDDPNLRTGDILVYRDDTRGDGHVVMAIDPEKRIGWDSHGWDGNPKILPVEPDKGVEYQKIKFKSDWKRWDRKTMTRKACWRYRAFVEETQSARGLPGLKALENICIASCNCGR